MQKLCINNNCYSFTLVWSISAGKSEINALREIAAPSA